MYLLDADVFIQAKNSHYGFDICPAFWEWIDEAHSSRRVFSIEKVRQELLPWGDELVDWARNRPDSFFLPPASDTVRSLRAVANWANSQAHQYTPTAISTFLGGADYYLVSQAHELGFIVITHERFEPNARNIIKIPNACKGMSLQCMTPFELLRSEGARFVLG